MKNLRAIASLGPFEVEEECLAACGATLSLCRYVFRGAREQPSFEVEFLSVNESDPAGLMLNYVTFESADLASAIREFESRAR
jgi:hypothetical protein